MTGGMGLISSARTAMRMTKKLEREINALMSAAAEALEAADFRGARKALSTTYDLLPEPKAAWDVAWLVLSSLADTEVALGRYAAARKHLALAIECAEADAGAIALSRGKLRFEEGDRGAAAEFLAVLLSKARSVSTEKIRSISSSRSEVRRRRRVSQLGRLCARRRERRRGERRRDCRSNREKKGGQRCTRPSKQGTCGLWKRRSRPE